MSWLKDRANVIGAVAGTIAAFVAVQQLFVVGPMNRRFDAMERHMNQRFEAVDQRFDAMDQRLDDQNKYIDERFDTVDQRFDAQDKYINQRFDAQDKYISQRFDAVDQRLERLEADVADLHRLSERVSRNEGEIDVIREQLQSADAP